MSEARQPTEANLSADAMRQIRDAMQESVRAGVREALTDREALAMFWACAFDAMQSRATRETGRFVLGGIRGLVSRGFWFLVLGAIAYQLGGWAALAAVWKAITGGGGH